MNEAPMPDTAAKPAGDNPSSPSSAAPKAEPTVDPLDALLKPRRGRKPKEPTWVDLLDKATSEGDLAGVIELCYPTEKRRLMMQCLRKAMQVVAQKDPGQLVEFLYKRILVFQGMQLIRAQIMADDGIRGYESSTKNVGVPDDVARELLPRVAVLQTEIQSTAQALARTMHTMALAGGGTQLDKKNLAKVVSIFEKQTASSDEATANESSGTVG